MGADPLKNVLGHLRRALLPPDGGGLTDGQLLAGFLADRDEAAFAALVRRHGPMVLGVCRRVLGHAEDAEDAFQATFLVLARKAASVVKREALAGFLYGVAYRTALRAKARAARRRATERQVKDMPDPEVPPAEAQDWRPVLDRELDLLPAHFRLPILLCDLEGKTRRAAARQLGLSEGTLSSRLARARRLLARRLTRYGLALSGGALATALAVGGASAAVPAELVATTVRAATLVAAGQAAGAATPAAILMNEVLKAMLMTKLKVYAAVALVAVLLGTGGLAFRAAGQPPAGERRTPDRPLTDLEMLRREVDILKLQVEVLQEKVRSQGAELRSLKGHAGAAPQTGAAEPRAANTTGPSTDRFTRQPTSDKMPPRGYGGGYTPAYPQNQFQPGQPGYGPPTTAAPAGDNPDREVEAALKALRQTPDDANVRERAVKVLERALERLKQSEKAGGQRVP
jgi:RNA polymerase sigma factor (sigma-70 family)